MKVVYDGTVEVLGANSEWVKFFRRIDPEIDPKDLRFTVVYERDKQGYEGLRFSVDEVEKFRFFSESDSVVHVNVTQRTTTFHPVADRLAPAGFGFLLPKSASRIFLMDVSENDRLLRTIFQTCGPNEDACADQLVNLANERPYAIARVTATNVTVQYKNPNLNKTSMNWQFEDMVEGWPKRIIFTEHGRNGETSAVLSFRLTDKSASNPVVNRATYTHDITIAETKKDGIALGGTYNPEEKELWTQHEQQLLRHQEREHGPSAFLVVGGVCLFLFTLIISRVLFKRIARHG